MVRLGYLLLDYLLSNDLESRFNWRVSSLAIFGVSMSV
jgi:hypothetical protein